MDPEHNNKTAVDTRNAHSDEAEETLSFSRVTAVATGWMLDFLFVSLCRSFKKEELDEFNESLSIFECKLFRLLV